MSAWHSAVTALAESMIGVSNVHSELSEMLHQQTEGNMFFLVEVIRALAEETGRLAHIPYADLPDSMLTQSIQSLLQRRIARVPVEYRQMLNLVAVSGRYLELDLLTLLFERTAATFSLDEWLLNCANAAVLDFDPADDNGFFFENNRFHFSGGEISYDYTGENVVTYTYPDDRDEVFFSYSLSTSTNRQASYAASDWDDVTGTITLTPDGMMVSGEVNLTIPTESSDTDEPAGVITLNIVLNDVEIENPDEYQEALDLVERRVALRQAQAEAVDLTVSGAFDLSIPPAEVLYSQNKLTISEPDVVLIEMELNRNNQPVTFMVEASCNRVVWSNICVTITQFQPDGNYVEFTENLGGEIVIESMEPLRATINITAEDMAGNTITLSGNLNDVPYPVE